MAAKGTTNDYADLAKRALGPATRLNETVVANVERIARFQYEITGDLLQFGLDQLHATVKAKDLPTLISKQRELATRFVEKAQARQQAFAELATESQADVARWIDDAAAVVTGKAA